ncbi:MBL fold metallo-hydrolase, partial [Escherichia coli]|nr:MBL fold metallo-hydrolase [Escherichia coli]
PALRAWAASLALVDRADGRRYLFDATPDLREQLEWLDAHDPKRTPGLGIDGIFLTHAHIGHYAGLMFLGRESANTKGVPVHAMPRMAEFLRNNGPW